MGNTVSEDEIDEEWPSEYEPVWDRCGDLQAEVEKLLETSIELMCKYHSGKLHDQPITIKKIVKKLHKQAKTVCVKFLYLVNLTSENPEIWRKQIEKFRKGYQASYKMANNLCLHSQWNTWPNFSDMCDLARSMQFECTPEEVMFKMGAADSGSCRQMHPFQNGNITYAPVKESQGLPPGCIPYIDESMFRELDFGADVIITLPEIKRSILSNREILKLKEPFAAMSLKLNEIKEIHDDLLYKYAYVDLEAIEIPNKQLLKELHDHAREAYTELCALWRILKDHRSFYPKKIKDAIKLSGAYCIDIVDVCCDFVVTNEPPAVTVLCKETSKLEVLAEAFYEYAELLAKASRSIIKIPKKQNIPPTLPTLPTTGEESKPEQKNQNTSARPRRGEDRNPYKEKMDVGSVEMEKQITWLEKELRLFDDFLDRYAPKHARNENDSYSSLGEGTEFRNYESDLPVTASTTRASRPVKQMASLLFEKAESIQRGWAFLYYRINFHFLDRQSDVYQLIEKGRTGLLDVRIALLTTRNPKLNFQKFKKFVQTQYSLIEKLRYSMNYFRVGKSSNE